MTGPEPGSDHRTVSTDHKPETLRLLPWTQADTTDARHVLARSGNGLETEGEILARHDRHLRGWSEGTAFFYLIELDGHCVGTIGYWYGHSRGLVAYEVAWSLTPDAPGRSVAVQSMRLLVEEAAEFPVPRFVHAFVPTDDTEGSAVCVDSGFDRVDVVERGEPLRCYADWAFDLAAVA